MVSCRSISFISFPTLLAFGAIQTFMTICFETHSHAVTYFYCCCCCRGSPSTRWFRIQFPSESARPWLCSLSVGWFALPSSRKAWGSRTGLSRPQAREFYIEAWRAVLRRRLSGGSADLSTASLAAGPGAAPVSVLAQPVGASDEDDVRSDIGCLCQLTSDGDVPGVCALLLRAPAAIRGTNSKGMTPLHLAADRGLVKLAELLIQKGASIDHADDEGETALHTAVMAERVEMINLLLRHGADASLQNHDGDTAEQLARTACTCPDVARAFANPQSTAP
eukprot:GHVT01080554.1.p1 GENE.GHVT01080554.1~~GHVT01080554.1.p1  ORF type:complete len:279 (+),score=47.79 GHVT01080554.1:2076-2912(+)